MAILFFEENIKRPRLKYRLISKWIKSIVKLNTKETGAISFVFCDNSFLLEINKKYLNHDYYTDIITFDNVNGRVIEGDIFISCEMVRTNSNEYGVTLQEEYLRVISHGILHLLGYGDASDMEKIIMRNKESECIALYKKIENGTINI